MFNAYVVEIEDDAAGLVIRSGGAFVFHAVGRAFTALDGVTFPNAAAAEAAARRLVRRRRPPRLAA